MMLQLSDREASILLGATLMHWGVPFQIAEKRELSDQPQAIMDAASEKLIAFRGTCQRTQLQEVQSVPLLDIEIDLLIRVVEDCLAECGNDSTELSLQLNTSEREEVEALLRRLRLAVRP